MLRNGLESNELDLQVLPCVVESADGLWSISCFYHLVWHCGSGQILLAAVLDTPALKQGANPVCLPGVLTSQWDAVWEVPIVQSQVSSVWELLSQ